MWSAQSCNPGAQDEQPQERGRHIIRLLYCYASEFQHWDSPEGTVEHYPAFLVPLLPFLCPTSSLDLSPTSSVLNSARRQSRATGVSSEAPWVCSWLQLPWPFSPADFYSCCSFFQEWHLSVLLPWPLYCSALLFSSLVSFLHLWPTCEVRGSGFFKKKSVAPP